MHAMVEKTIIIIFRVVRYYMFFVIFLGIRYTSCWFTRMRLYYLFASSTIYYYSWINLRIDDLTVYYKLYIIRVLLYLLIVYKTGGEVLVWDKCFESCFKLLFTLWTIMCRCTYIMCRISRLLKIENKIHLSRYAFMSAVIV